MKPATLLGLFSMAIAANALPSNGNSTSSDAKSIQSASDIKRDPTGSGRLNILEDGTLQSIAKNGTILDERQVGKEFYEKQSKQLQKAKANKKPTGKEQSKNDIGPRFNCSAYICEEDPDCYPLNCSMCLTVNGYLGTCWNW